MSDPQDMITRMVYVIRAKPELISTLEFILDPDEKEKLSRPFVVMTKEHPYELYFESWHPFIAKACKKEFLRYESEYGLLVKVIQEILDIDFEKNDLRTNFDRWWHIEHAIDWTEIEPSWLLKEEREERGQV